MRFVLQTLRLRVIVGAVVCGFLLSLATGLVENSPEASIIIFEYYGYPLVWRVTQTSGPTQFRLTSLAIDAIFWIAISLLVLIILELLKTKVGFEYKTFLFPLVLLVPLGLVMDFVHEFGHALWGTAVGGRLTYMQIAYFEIYPRLAITPHFQLGVAQIEGLTTEFAQGVMRLGGSSTTNIVSWLLALILLRVSLGYRTQVSLRILGLFGLLDLPFYVIFPQIGFRHWIFLGGCQPEPLLGARRMGLPDTVFYVMVILTTAGLVLLYFKPFWQRVEKKMRILLGIVRSKHGENLESSANAPLS